VWLSFWNTFHCVARPLDTFLRDKLTYFGILGSIVDCKDNHNDSLHNQFGDNVAVEQSR
jgi:hypothetical protein